MKKQAIILLTALLATGQYAFADGFSAVAPSGQTLNYNIITDISVEVVNSSNVAGDLIIPESVTNNGNTYAVTRIGWGAFSGCTGLLSLEVSNSVTEIDNVAFENCHNLTSVTFGDSLSIIGVEAFAECTRLTSIHFGDGLAYIKNRAFQNCGIMGELVIPQSVISIEWMGFYHCYGITEITCLGRVAPIVGDDSFSGVDTSITVNIPCNTRSLYAGRWSYFHNFNETPYQFNVASADPTQGTVAMLQEPTCDNPVAIVQATPHHGYRFEHWSNGSTQNPYTHNVMGNMTLTAYFTSTMPQYIDDVNAAHITLYAERRHIVIEGATGMAVSVYDMMGREVFNGLAGKTHALPAGVYLVKVGTLPARKVVVK